MVIGHLGRDPEMRYLPDGRPVTDFTLAVTGRWKDSNGERQEHTTWMRVNAWSGLAEVCNDNLRKGAKVMVQGRCDSKAWLDKDNKPQAEVLITATSVEFLTPKPAEVPA